MAKKLYVGNLSYNTSEDSLRNLFSNYGNVASAKIIFDRDTGSSKGFGFVEMGSDEEAATWAELDVVWRRARLLRLSITLATVSVLGVVLTVFGLFLHLLAWLPTQGLVLGVFGLSLAALAASLVCFLLDLGLSLHALEHEIEQARGVAKRAE